MNVEIDLRWSVILNDQPNGVSITHTETCAMAERENVTHDLTNKAHLVERSYDGPPRTLCGAFASRDCKESDNLGVCPVCVFRAIDMGWM